MPDKDGDSTHEPAKRTRATMKEARWQRQASINCIKLSKCHVRAWCWDSMLRHCQQAPCRAASWETQKAKQLMTALSRAQATRLTMAPSSSFSAAVNTNALRFNRAKNHQQQQQQQKALWYNNFRMGNYRKMRQFVREKLKGMAKRIKYL